MEEKQAIFEAEPTEAKGREAIKNWHKAHQLTKQKADQEAQDKQFKALMAKELTRKVNGSSTTPEQAWASALAAHDLDGSGKNGKNGHLHPTVGAVLNACHGSAVHVPGADGCEAGEVGDGKEW